MTLERAALLAMGSGLLLVVQPWSHFLFTAGFPLVLVGVLAYNASAWFGEGRGEDGP